MASDPGNIDSRSSRPGLRWPIVLVAVAGLAAFFFTLVGGMGRRGGWIGMPGGYYGGGRGGGFGGGGFRGGGGGFGGGGASGRW